MTRAIHSRSNVEFLKKEAKQWLKSLQAGDAEAMVRLKKALPDEDTSNPSDLTLRTVQYALAREHGVEGWLALTGSIDTRGRELREIADKILRHALFKGDPPVATGLYESHPEIATLNLFTAVAAGDLAEVNRRLAADPSSAARAGGPLKWPPMLYLTYMRLPGGAVQSVEIARALLDRGADANSSWIHSSSNVAFYALTGAIALGEGLHPTHERADELVALLIERGADPCDSQALYNTSIVSDDVHWLDVLWSHSERRGMTNTWREVSKQRIGGNRGMSPIDFMLSLAVSHNLPQRAEWLLVHGGNANGVQAHSGRRLRQEALLNGSEAIAELLLRHGSADEPLQGLAAFKGACRRLDRKEASRLGELHPEYLRDPEAMLTAARQGRLDVVELLLELGMDVDIENERGVRALYAAIATNKIDVAELLIARGANVDRPMQDHGGPMGFAAQLGRREIAKVLAPLSRDVHSMVYLGMKDRLRDLFTAEPELANLIHFRSRQTPLFSLPDEEASALDMAKFLLEHGANVRFKKGGDTAANAASKRGLNEVARLLTDAMTRR
jgi:ankyrin repeat protein